jgi:lysophospholipase L1-like esterase
MAVKIRNGQTLLFIGDSITDCGRRDVNAPLGSGYVRLFADMLRMREPAKTVTLLNKGISGNTILDLQDRWEDDVMRHAPDWLAVKIGINDLHRTYSPVAGIAPVPPERFRAVYDALLDRTRSRFPRVRLLLIEPFYISRDRSPHAFRSKVLHVLPAYLAVVHAMSRAYDTRLVRTHALFQKLLRYHEADVFCPEPVHPYPNGHLAIAEAVYNALAA